MRPSFKAEEREGDKYTLIANRIRILTFGCKNQDPLSSEFGNEFAPKVEEYLREAFPDND